MTASQHDSMTAKRLERVGEIASQFKRKRLSPNSPSVERMVQTYRDKFGLGPREQATERAQEWVGMQYRGKIVAVFGERREAPGTLEVTDAYFEGRPGRIAFLTMFRAYRSMAESGTIDALILTVLFRNLATWTGLVRETKTAPEVMVFVFRKGGA